ncbi:hypothetical protein C3747_63g113 [Trypanosoma cruzi]|uniref:LicD/FKTN/FKRP nucleotidyltransferase domain-containing protein n=2 Tax=Trypanosoma cruzi TaxID=5693 RepID=Q4DTV0_TRYCC|nr:hypothetical protein, conserved [Trypanosoma cruzi]EAN95959.1 hypothetical protein, conserved [Trypanosoma cruzi]PWV11069.1 hypothetical protein C3747_63g113 [Trypanosoma cruzi]RNC46975.1 hypothetical protein TcCL_NonESM03237 [Trypanosoma cruzi]|eukprot:XP_817810.1 hypothetical protein [Trypanosoma cruzi strain CL Brener]
MIKGYPKSGETLGLYWTRAIVVVLLGIVVYVAVTYCFHVYYDREAAFRNALTCSMRFLEENKIVFWLQNGTLLGSTRLGRLVLWDADLDIGFKRSDDTDKVVAMMNELDSRCFGVVSTVRVSLQNSVRVFRKCTKRICAEFHETIVNDGVVISVDGSSPEKELFPLQRCTVADVVSHCPHNAPYYLKEAYGGDWLTRSLTELFQ